MQVKDPGIYEMKMQHYIKDPCPEPSLNKGCVMDLYQKSPAHAWLNHPRLGGATTESHRADLGSAAHALVVGGDRKIAIMPEQFKDWRKQEVQQWAEQARQEDRIPILYVDYQKIVDMNHKAQKILYKFKGMVPEQTLVGKYNPYNINGGVWLRCRPDMISSDRSIVIEYKTTTDANPYRWGKTTLFNAGYDIQQAMAVKILGQLDHMNVKVFFLVQELCDPYACSLIQLSQESIDYAETHIDRAAALWYNCLKNNEWPDYAGCLNIVKIDPPRQRMVLCE